MPEIKVEIAWSSGFSTPMSARTYTDVSPWVEGRQETVVNYGRPDELAAPSPGTCTLTLDNRDGRFTPEKATSPYYPNVKTGKPIRVSVRYADEGAGNYLTANQASFETSVATWSSVSATLASSSVRAQVGTKSLLVTWPAGGFTYASTTVTGLTVGRTYTASAYLYVPAGSVACALEIFGVTSGSPTTTATGVWQRLSVTFVATASSHAVCVFPAVAPSAGQQVWVDAVMVDDGPTLTAFTTAAPPWRVRFTGYVDEWPLTWPDGSHAVSAITLSCSSRQARLGNSAPLGSSIRTAYLASSPQRYWPMDDDPGEHLVAADNRPLFYDVLAPPEVPYAHDLALWYSNNALEPTTEALRVHQRDGTAGPNDELSLVHFPSYTDAGLIGTSPHAITAFGACRVNTAGELTMQAVARIVPLSSDLNLATILELRTGNHSAAMLMSTFGLVDADTSTIEDALQLVNADTGAVVENISSQVRPDLFAEATDGQIHHYAMTLTGGNTARFYFDGMLYDTVTLASHTFTDPFVLPKFGAETYKADLWIGHGMVHDRALSGAEIAVIAQAATASTATIQERVERIAGYLGVPAAETSVETSVASPLGLQHEKDRSAIEVLTEIAESTGGIVYDNRDGVLVMQARNHRYNSALAFTLNATQQEIEGNLEAVLDRRYLWNSVHVDLPNADLSLDLADQPSIDEYGIYSPRALSVVTTHIYEPISAAQNVLIRYAQPRVRVSTVAADALNLSTAQRSAVLGADISSRLAIAGLPSQAPTDPMYLFVEGYTETISATSHVLSFNTTSADGYEGWVLDDATKSNLDTTTFAVY